jgi:integrase
MSRYSDLIKIEGHKNYYRNPVSQIIYFKKDGTKISTGEKQILRAKRAAEVKLAEKNRTATKAQIFRKQAKIKNPYIEHVWNELLEAKRPEVEPSTMRNYHKSWKYGFGPFWKDKTVKDLTDENILKYRAWYLETNPTRKFEHTYVHFGMTVRSAFDRRIINEKPNLNLLKNLDETISKNAKRPPVGRVYTEEECEDLLYAADTYAETKIGGTTLKHKRILENRARLGVRLGLKAGLRKMEALKLRWENVNQKKMIMNVWSQKNHKWREVPLLPELLALFKAQQELVGKTPWVFPMPSDPTRHISSQVFDKVWIRVKQLAETVGRARFHDLRHTFASKTAEDSWPPITACEVLDMSLNEYQKTYAKTSAAKKAEMMRMSFGKK